MKNPVIITYLFLFAISLNATANQFTPILTDKKTGLIWGKTIPGKFTNGCMERNADGKITESGCRIRMSSKKEKLVANSAAITACENLGARLPSQFEFESLIRNFDHTDIPSDPKYLPNDLRLTEKGVEQMRAAFGDLDKPIWAQYWASTAIEIFEGKYYGASLFETNQMLHQWRTYEYWVRCVKEVQL